MRQTITTLRCSLLLAVVAAIVGCGQPSQRAGTDTLLPDKEFHPSKASQSNTGSGPRGKEPPSSKEVDPSDTGRNQPPPDFSMTAKAFYDEVTGGVSAAARKYSGRVVELTGKVVRIGRNPGDPEGPPSITLGDAHHVVQCITADKRPWQKCVPGQGVKVRGTVSAAQLFTVVGMQECEVTAATGDPAVTVTAADLLSEIAADETAARKKYDGKVVFLSGELASVKEGDSSLERVVELKGKGKRQVHCLAWSSDEPFLKKLKTGEPVTFLGELHLKGEKVELRNALLTRASVLGQ